MVSERPYPMCSRCRNHGKINRIKNHKYYCPFLACCCAKCIVLKEKQRIMAKQIYIRRKQDELGKFAPKSLIFDNQTNPTNVTTNEPHMVPPKMVIDYKTNMNFSPNYNQIRRAANTLQKLFPKLSFCMFAQLLIKFNYDIIAVIEFLTSSLTVPFV